MTKIEKKCNAEYFQQILDGKKSFEVRLNDFEIDEGDALVLREWNPEKMEYTGRMLEKQVVGVNKFMLKDFTQFWPQEDLDASGIQIISFTV